MILVFIGDFGDSMATPGDDSGQSVQAMVVTNHQHATDAAVQILKDGGNAVDAAVAAMFVLSVVEPWASGPGGGGLMMVSEPHKAGVTVIDFKEKAPLNATEQLFYHDEDAFGYNAYAGYRSVCVPGMIAGVTTALNKFGTMTQGEVVQPAIDIARTGFVVSERFNTMLWRYYDLVERYQATSIIYMPDLVPIPVDETMQREDLAVTLETLSLRGFRDFYHGVMAEDIVDEFKLNDGLLSLDDFASYTTMSRNPLRTTYRDYDIVTNPLPSTGGISLIQVMKLAERSTISQTKHNSGAYIHHLIEAVYQAERDSREYSRDPEAYPIDISTFLSDEHIELLNSRIDSLHDSEAEYGGDPYKLKSQNSSPICVIDANGMAVTVNQTINFYFGSQITHPKYGILFNNGLYSFSQDSLSVDRIESGKKSASNLFSTIIYKDGKPHLLINSTGESCSVIVTAHLICSILDFGLSVEEAIDSPRFYAEDGVVHLEMRIDSESIEELKRRGHAVKLRTNYNTDFGLAQVIYIGGDTSIYGAVDPRGEGTVGGF